MSEANFLELISGKRKGVLSSLLRGVLWGLSFGYRAIVGFRNRLYDNSLRKAKQVSVPVISVGNLTTGGTGKTPVVAYLANWYRNRSCNPVLLSRGYRALDQSSNDEKLVLEYHCPGIVHLQHPNRFQSAQTAIQDYQAKVLILDDGFQHRQLNRDCNIVLIDATNPFGYNYMLPRGLLREPLSSLKRADLVILTRVDQCSAQEIKVLKERIHHIHHQPIIEISFPFTSLIDLQGNTEPIGKLEGKQIGAFCGIGNPTSFQNALHQSQADLLWFHAFPDHHHYSERDFDFIQKQSKAHHVSAMVTTLKDLVKIPVEREWELPLWSPGIEVCIHEGKELLETKLHSLLNVALQ